MRVFCKLILLAGTASASAQVLQAGDADWPAYGGDAGGQRYSVHKQIDTVNVTQLQVAWSFHTGSFAKPSPTSNPRANFEATPVLWHGMLFFDTPFDETFAIDARTGKKVWSFDPEVNREGAIYIVTSRGVALWHGKSASPAPCGQHRVFVATLDRRLIARDATTGLACENFGNRGTVDLAAGMKLKPGTLGMYGFTSPPTVVGDVVVVGSSVADNYTIDSPAGAVRGFDVRTGSQLWSWNPIPWADGKQLHAGSGNAWSIIAADPAHDLLFVPTGSPSVDFYGGLRPGDNRDADSIVALRASTGQRVWTFQFVHHDLWDYDTPSEPLLFTFRNKIPAVAVTTKTGMIFVFNRLTGEPLYPIQERPVPQSELPGEHTWPTQPFSTLPTLTPLTFRPSDVVFTDKSEQAICREKLTPLINKGIFTPPAAQDSLLYPGPLGGANWGSAGIDPVTGTLYVHTNNLAYVMRQTLKQKTLWQQFLIHVDRHVPASLKKSLPQAYSRFRTPDSGEHTQQEGTPYELYREAISTPRNTPCTPQPWASVVAINLNTGFKAWSVPQGTMVPGQNTGSLGVGGPVVTAGGLVFIGATMEPVLRAYKSSDGTLLWEGAIPAAANSTPMSYELDNKQYIVVAAGGNGMLGAPQSDTVIAFALPSASSMAHPASKHTPAH